MPFIALPTRTVADGIASEVNRSFANVLDGFALGFKEAVSAVGADQAHTWIFQQTQPKETEKAS